MFVFQVGQKEMRNEPAGFKQAEVLSEKEREAVLPQQKLKVIPLDAFPGARELMMSLNEKSGSNFRAKGLDMDTAEANQKFTYALMLAAKYAQIGVTDEKGHLDSGTFASLNERQRAQVFAIAEVVAIRGEGNAKALMEKYSSSSYTSKGLLKTIWDEETGNSRLVELMGLKTKSSTDFWSDHFKEAVSGLEKEAPQKLAQGPASTVARDEKEDRVKEVLGQKEKPTPPQGFSAVSEGEHQQPAAGPEAGTASGRSKASPLIEPKKADEKGISELATHQLNSLVHLLGLDGKYFVEYSGLEYKIRASDADKPVWQMRIQEGDRIQTESGHGEDYYLRITREDRTFLFLFENNNGRLSVTRAPEAPVAKSDAEGEAPAKAPVLTALEARRNKALDEAHDIIYGKRRADGTLDGSGYNTNDDNKYNALPLEEKKLYLNILRAYERGMRSDEFDAEELENATKAFKDKLAQSGT